MIYWNVQEFVPFAPWEARLRRLLGLTPADGRWIAVGPDYTRRADAVGSLVRCREACRGAAFRLNVSHITALAA